MAKQSSARSPAKAPAKTKVTAKEKAPSSPNPASQPAAERREAEATLDALIDKFTPGQQKPVSAMRRTLKKRLPTANEVVYEYSDCFLVSYSPSTQGYEGVFGIRGSAEGLRLYITRAKELPDPAKVLRSSGGQQRWVDLDGAATLARPEIARLIDAAIALNRTPFEPTGRGSVITSQSTKKRQKTRAA